MLDWIGAGAWRLKKGRPNLARTADRNEIPTPTVRKPYHTIPYTYHTYELYGVDMYGNVGRYGT